MVNFTQILLGLYVGSYPESPEDIEELKARCGVTAVLNLQTDEDIKGKGLNWPALAACYQACGIEVRRVPMRDGDVEDQHRKLPEAVRALAGLLAAGHTVYLHCNAGAGRSPLVAMAYLHRSRGWPLEEAIGYVQQCRPCAPYVHLLSLTEEDIRRDGAV